MEIDKVLFSKILALNTKTANRMSEAKINFERQLDEITKSAERELEDLFPSEKAGEA